MTNIYTCISVAKTGKVETKARLDPDFHNEVSHALVDRGISMQKAIEDGLRLWLKGKGETGVSEIKDSGGIAKTLPGKYSGSAAGDQGQSEDWRVEMAMEVLNSEHPVAGVALTANIISFGLLVRQQGTHNHAALDPEFRARIQKAREENERIRAAIEELRGKSARSGKPLPPKRET
jgi:hypothetical protein